jgi:hypothetical protein
VSLNERDGKRCCARKVVTALGFEGACRMLLAHRHVERESVALRVGVTVDFDQSAHARARTELERFCA